MANTKEIRRRIKSISSTLQITGALELVSSIKMRQAVATALKSREFSRNIWSLIQTIKQEGAAIESMPVWFNANPKAAKNLLIVIASDKGLAGSYNSNVIKTAKQYLAENPTLETDLIIVGKKIRGLAHTSDNVHLISEFAYQSEELNFFQSHPIAQIALDGFESGQYANVTVVYTHFVNTLKQESTKIQLLPLQAPDFDAEPDPEQDYIFEPDRSALLHNLGRQIIISIIYQTLLEGSASEHSARMVAMKNANDNGQQLVSDLTFTYNKLRQQSITSEIAEISAGRIALQ